MSAVAEVVHAKPHRVSLLETFSKKYDLEPGKMLDTLKGTAFKNPNGGPPITNEQMMALLVVANQYNLNPFTKEIYAFPDKRGGIVPVVGVDGWTRIVNEHPQYDGCEFEYGPDEGKGPEWIQCAMYRKDRSRPTVIRELLRECRRGTEPWNTSPQRMLRHRAFIQSARLAFSFAGIYDPDEAERIIDGDVRVVSNDAVHELNRRIESRHSPDPTMPVGEVIDGDGVITEQPSRDVDAEQAAGLEQATQPPADSAAAPSLSFAQIAERIKAAKSTDEIDEAASLIESLPALDQKKELTALFRELRAKLAGE